MLYQILKPLTNIFYQIYYTFQLKGKNKIPYGNPIILSPNHTNGFIDPVILGSVLKSKVRFFARGDVFKGPVLKWILNDLNMSPMYRLQEGYSEIKKNDATFEECKKLLSENKTILIFPEAIAVQEKRLQPLKKGLSRIVFQTEEAFDFKKNVLVVPIGLNYSNAKKFRSKLLIRIGEPISLKKYEEEFKENKVKAINNFTRMLEQEMRKLIITIKDKNNDELVENITEIYLREWMIEKKYDLKNLEEEFYVREGIAELVNYQSENNLEALNSLKEKISPYLQQLHKQSLRDHLLSPITINNTKPWDFLLEFIVIWIGMPIYGLGLLMNYLPYFISKKFVVKNIKKAEFIASIYANMAMFLWIFNYLIQLLIVALVFRNWALLGFYAVLVPLLGMFALNYYSIMKKIFGRWRLLRLVRKDRATVETLMQERAEIIERLDTMKLEILNFSK